MRGKDYKLDRLSSPSTPSLHPLPLHFSEMFPLLPILLMVPRYE